MDENYMHPEIKDMYHCHPHHFLEIFKTQVNEPIGSYQIQHLNLIEILTKGKNWFPMSLHLATQGRKFPLIHWYTLPPGSKWFNHLTYHFDAYRDSIQGVSQYQMVWGHKKALFWKLSSLAHFLTLENPIDFQKKLKKATVEYLCNYGKNICWSSHENLMHGCVYFMFYQSPLHIISKRYF